MGNKLSHLGMSGHLAVMSELLRLGYNVALPYVDVGEDIYLIDDRSGELVARLQVKTSTGTPHKKSPSVSGAFQVPRAQLAQGKKVALYYVFALDHQGDWDLVVCPREELFRIRLAWEQTAPKEASGETNKLTLTFTQGEVRGWGDSFQKYRRAFERYFPRVTSGPGAR